MDIVATGMVCSVGLSAASACAAMRAKIAKFDDLPYLDNQGEPIVGASVPGLEPGLKRRQRLVEMLSMALADCLESADVKQIGRIPLQVGLAEPGRPGGGADWADTIIRDVEAKLEIRFDPKHSATLSKGHTAGFEALRLACEILKDPAVPACLVCGVDSYINASSLLWLQRNSRLKTPEDSDGVIPGEAAACVLLIRGGAKPRDGGVSRVSGLGFAREEASVMTDEPLLGRGLVEAASAALGEAGSALDQVDFRLSDATGEHYGFKEHSLMVSRLLRGRRDSFPIWHPGDMIGDTGAAAGPVQLVVADRAFRRGYAPGDRALCLTSSVPGDRSAAILQFQRI